MVSLIFRRIVRIALPLWLMLVVSGSMTGTLNATESSGRTPIVPVTQPVSKTAESDSFFSLNYWTAPAIVAVLSGLMVPLYLNWGKQKLEDRKKARRYRAFIREKLGKIGMPGLPGGIRNISVDLDDGTFVKLRFSEGVESENDDENVANLLKESRDEGLPDEIMMRAFRNGRKLLLVFGDPGAGKTTLLQYYALCALDGNQCRRLGFSSPPNVFYLPLRELDATLTLAENHAKHAASFGIGIDAALFGKWLEKPSLVLLDGLDEISDTKKRESVCRWIDRQVQGTKSNSFVVTSRYTGYGQDEERNIDITLHLEHKRAHILDFSMEQQEKFLRGWFAAAFLKDERANAIDETKWKQDQTERARIKGDRIIAVLKEEQNLVLRQLAGIPMILQLMALIWKENDYLPSGRIELYDSALDYMLQLRDKQKNIDAPLKAAQGRRVLAPIAWWMQYELKNDETEQQAMHSKMEPELATLADRQCTPPTPEAYCEHLIDRAGVLMRDGENYQFRHKSFREYLASIELLRLCRLRTPGFLDELIKVFGEGWWNEPIRFFIAQSDAELFDYLIDRIIGSVNDEPLSQEQRRLLDYIIDEAPQKKVDALCSNLLDENSTDVRQRLVLDCLLAIGQTGAIQSIRKFREISQAKNKDIAVRAKEVIIALDPAFADIDTPWTVVLTTLSSSVELPASYRNPVEYLAEYILIKNGSFRYSLFGKTETIPDIYFAKYPVTNRQYRRFINYLQYGSIQDIKSPVSIEYFKSALHKFATNSWPQILLQHLKSKKEMSALFKSSYDESRKLGSDDQPVVGVSWYAARTYCFWLSMLESGGKKFDLYRLPTEKEWEFAAAGAEGRRFPWGNETPSKRHVNLNNNEGLTIPVGRYPDGATPEGLYDMTGNVIQWMEICHNHSLTCSLRGGSWFNNTGSLSCSSLLNHNPVNMTDYFGFRVVRPVPKS
jgi:formylglycine-generating enzyme required for sulfatase activity